MRKGSPGSRRHAAQETALPSRCGRLLPALAVAKSTRDEFIGVAKGAILRSSALPGNATVRRALEDRRSIGKSHASLLMCGRSGVTTPRHAHIRFVAVGDASGRPEADASMAAVAEWLGLAT